MTATAATTAHEPTAPDPGGHEATLTQYTNALWLFFTFVGGALILNSYIAAFTYEASLPADERIVSSLCALVGAIFLSAPLVLRAARETLNGNVYVGELAALAVIACFAIQKYQEAGLVAFFLMLAELLESRTALGAREAVEGLIKLTPRQARILRDGSETEVDVSALRPGDVVRVRPGENVPADGVIRKGDSTLDQALVTGESLPVDRSPGDAVFAGTINITGLIDVEVTKVGEDTTLGKVRHLILEAEATRLPIMRLIDQYVKWYTPVIVMIAAMILFFTKDVNNAITALVVACPCALVLATPTAMVAGLTCAARLGILIKNVKHLESSADINAVVFDKTGTLTMGELTVSRLAPAGEIDPAELLRFAASADRHSNHPAARALQRVAAEARVDLTEPEAFVETGGKGVRATVEGRRVLVGRLSWMEEHNVDLAAVEAPTRTEAEGFSTLYVAVDGRGIGWVGMVDRARPEARRATESLQELGIRNLTMLTGDRWGVARRVAGELGCTDLVAECLPEQKLELVESMKARGYKVAVVGDGVNDAPALAAGDLGVAMGAAGNDIAIHSASIALLSDDLQRLPFLVRLSRRVRRVVLENLVFGGAFVVAGLAAAGAGLLTPIFAALLHNVGSFIVIFNSARIVRFGEEFRPFRPGR